MLGHRFIAISADIAYRHAGGARRLQIDIVHPRGRHGNQPQLRIGCNHAGINHNFIGNHHIGAGNAGGGVGRFNAAKFTQAVCKIKGKRAVYQSFALEHGNFQGGHILLSIE